MKFEVTFSGRLACRADYEGEVFDQSVEIERAFSATMRELVKLGVEDASVDGAAASGEVELSGTFDGESPVDALNTADTTFRSALHAAGVFTTGWDTDAHRLWMHISHVEADDLVDHPVS
jgi:hypothetical protein